jgi:hypothetical protein
MYTGDNNTFDSESTLMRATLIFYVPFLCSLFSLNLAGSDAGNVAITVRPKSSSVNSTGPIRFAYEIKNASHGSILIDSKPVIPLQLVPEVVGPDGKTVEWQGAVTRGDPPIHFTLLYANSALTGELEIPRNCDPYSPYGGYCFPRPGKYSGILIYRSSSYELSKTLGCIRGFASGPYSSNRFELTFE